MNRRVRCFAFWQLMEQKQYQIEILHLLQVLALFRRANCTASATRFVSSETADPFVEKLSIATRGSISNILAVFALSTAISAKS